jgi:hypothetical protein
MNISKHRRATFPARKYADDAAILEAALSTATDPFLISRYTFYLAQSYRDCSQHEKALVNYLKRATMGFWDQEIFVSLYEAAKLSESLDFAVPEVIAAYLEAANRLPGRAEALHGLSRFCRRHGRNEEGYVYAKRGIALPYPTEGLFVAGWIYDYGLLDELAVNAYWAGYFRESLDACLTLLSMAKLPASERDRVAANARFAAAKLPSPPSLAAFGCAQLPDQTRMLPARPLRSRLTATPRVLLAILAKQKEKALPLYLDCIEALDYPKSAIALYIRTNNNTDRTRLLLRDWVSRRGYQYASVDFDATDVDEPVERLGVHEWNALRFRVLGHIRSMSMQRALERHCNFYFVADVDNFIRPCTLKELVALNLPIVSPLLRAIQPGSVYSNYHADIDQNGYYRECDQYHWILNGHIRGVFEVPVIHCTYLVRSDILPELSYEDGSERHEYVILSDSARRARIPQYIDNRQVYGYLTFGEGDGHYVPDGIERGRSLLQAQGKGGEAV